MKRLLVWLRYLEIVGAILLQHKLQMEELGCLLQEIQKSCYRSFLKLWIVTVIKSVEHLCVNSSRWRDNIDDAPLNKRGWVTQERSLSPRVLHFAAGEIFFECQRVRASETFFEGERTKNRFDGLDDNGYPLSSVIRTSVTETSMQYATKAWCWQIYRYSSGRLKTNR
jgi:hypothetical protein